MTQPGLFDIAPADVKPRKPKKPSGPPSWTSNATKAICYDCIERLANGEWVTPVRAQWRRTHGDDLGLYCYTHAQPRRDADHKAAQRAG